MLHLNSRLEIPCTASKCSGWKWHTARCWGRLCRDDRRDRGTELFMQLQLQLCQLYLFACPANIQSTHASGKQMVVAQRKVTIVRFAEWCQDSLEHFFISPMKLFHHESSVPLETGTLCGRNIALNPKRSAKTYPLKSKHMNYVTSRTAICCRAIYCRGPARRSPWCGSITIPELTMFSLDLSRIGSDDSTFRKQY